MLNFFESYNKYEAEFLRQRREKTVVDKAVISFYRKYKTKKKSIFIDVSSVQNEVIYLTEYRKKSLTIKVNVRSTEKL
jgi:hypothetical protein